MKNLQTKNIFKTLLVALCLLALTFTLVGCGSKSDLTKDNYLTAFNSVQNVLNAQYLAIKNGSSSNIQANNASSLDVTIESTDFVDLETWQEDEYISMVAFPSITFGYVYSNALVKVNSNSKHKMDKIVQGIANNGQALLNNKFETSNKDGKIYASCIISVIGELSYMAFLSYSIDYDFENSKLNSFRFAMYMDTDLETERGLLAMVEYKASTGLKGLTRESSQYNTIKESMQVEAIKLMNAEAKETDYDFTSCFALVSSGEEE